MEGIAVIDNERRGSEWRFYVFGQPKEYESIGADYAQTYNQQVYGEDAPSVKYVCVDLPDQRDIGLYKKAGICEEQILCVHQFFTDNCMMVPTVKVQDKLKELEYSLHCTQVDYRNSDIKLIKDGYVIASILLDKSCFWAILYFSYAKLLRMEVYTDHMVYANYYVTAKSENRLYAKLARRCFYNKDGAVAYDQIFEKENERYLFPDGRCYTKPQFVAEFIRELNLSEEDRVILDASVSEEVM